MPEKEPSRRRKPDFSKIVDGFYLQTTEQRKTLERRVVRAANAQGLVPSESFGGVLVYSGEDSKPGQVPRHFYTAGVELDSGGRIAFQ